jgi:tRNA (guanine9-N1)-methyltransferase
MENLDFLNNIDDMLYPEDQEEYEELAKIKKEEKSQRKAEHLKNHPEHIQNIEHSKEYIKNKTKERKYNRRQRAKKRMYMKVKDMTKEEKEKFYDNYFKEKEMLKEKEKEDLIKAYNSNFIVCFDLDYNNCMDKKEKHSLVVQLSLCYNLNKKNKKKINFYLTKMNQEITDNLNKNHGDKWMVHYSDKPFYLIDELIKMKKEFVYLSPDADEDLLDVSEDQIYIVGGLVDRTVIKNRSMLRFNNIKNNDINDNEGKNEIKIVAKKLPLQKYFENLYNHILIFLLLSKKARICL